MKNKARKTKRTPLRRTRTQHRSRCWSCRDPAAPTRHLFLGFGTGDTVMAGTEIADGSAPRAASAGRFDMICCWSATVKCAFALTERLPRRYIVGCVSPGRPSSSRAHAPSRGVMNATPQQCMLLTALYIVIYQVYIYIYIIYTSIVPVAGFINPTPQCRLHYTVLVRWAG